MAISMYQAHEADAREDAHNLYVSDPGFSDLEEKARAKGFRKATLSEINASAENKGHMAPDLYCWAGGLWAKSNGARP